MADKPEDIIRHENVVTLNAMSDVIHRACVEYLRVARLGASASMNGSLDYVGFAILEKLREMGWRPCPPEAECWKAEADALRRIVLDALAEFEMDSDISLLPDSHWTKRARKLFEID